MARAPPRRRNRGRVSRSGVERIYLKRIAVLSAFFVKKDSRESLLGREGFACRDRFSPVERVARRCGAVVPVAPRNSWASFLLGRDYATDAADEHPRAVATWLAAVHHRDRRLSRTGCRNLERMSARDRKGSVTALRSRGALSPEKETYVPLARTPGRRSSRSRRRGAAARNFASSSRSARRESPRVRWRLTSECPSESPLRPL